MAKSYQVVAPYVTLKVKDQVGSFVVTGYYAGGVVGAEIDAESLQHHLDSGMLREVSVDSDGRIKSDPEEDFALFGSGGAGAPEVVNTFPSSEELLGGGDEADDSAPAASASKGDWEDYARSQGASDEDLEGLTKAEIVEQYGS